MIRGGHCAVRLRLLIGLTFSTIFFQNNEVVVIFDDVLLKWFVDMTTHVPLYSWGYSIPSGKGTLQRLLSDLSFKYVICVRAN
jgi:hypothetical protein